MGWDQCVQGAAIKGGHNVTLLKKLLSTRIVTLLILLCMEGRVVGQNVCIVLQ